MEYTTEYEEAGNIPFMYEALEGQGYWRNPSRRRFLKGLGVLAVGALLARASLVPEKRFNPILKIPYDDDPSISFSEQRAFITRLDNMIDSLPKRDFPHEAVDVLQIEAEVLPYFESEGIVDGATPPSATNFSVFLDAGQHQGVLARTNCLTGEVQMNARLVNPHSHWFGRKDVMAIVTHELAHVEGACDLRARLLTETSAQLISLEVLAALANDGNTEALYSLLYELRGISLGAMSYDTMKSEDHDEYRAFLRAISDNPVQTDSKQDRYERKISEAERMIVAYAYAKTPFEMMLKGLQKGEIRDIILPINIRMVKDRYGRDIPYNTKKKALKIDDLSYFLEHAEEMSGEVGESGERN